MNKRRWDSDSSEYKRPELLPNEGTEQEWDNDVSDYRRLFEENTIKDYRHERVKEKQIKAYGSWSWKF